jgi:hypothetical protein
MLLDSLPMRLIADMPGRRCDFVADIGVGPIAILVDQRLSFVTIANALGVFSTEYKQHHRFSVCGYACRASTPDCK